MITKSQRSASQSDPDSLRWQALSSREKLEEFSELTQSPYWQFLPEEVKSTIRSLLDH